MAICIAIVAVLIRSIQVPFAPTAGYTHPGAIAEVFIALAFGPVVGGIAAGWWCTADAHLDLPAVATRRLL
ncbi:MAG: ECF transporter S component [Ardenticatenales bacterium]|nr:ECF transporter S component [Ardenticatenales bacterium]